MLSEKMIELGFARYAESRNCEALKLRIDGGNGFPDRSILTPGGRACFIEFKKPGGRLSQLQIKWLARLGELGFPAESFDRLEDSIDFLDSFLLRGDYTQ